MVATEEEKAKQVKVEKEDVVKQLDRATEDYRARVAERFEIRKWCMTTWGVFIVAFLSGKLKLSDTDTFLVLFAPIVIFLFLR